MLVFFFNIISSIFNGIKISSAQFALGATYFKLYSAVEW